jgi:nicotinamide phosphoribosyltransferase
MNKKNIILSSDSYKYSHYLQYPLGTETVYSYIESRGSDDPTIDKTVFLGIQAYIKEYLLEPFTAEDIDEAEEIITTHGEPFNREGWEHILNEHAGYLPLEIEAVPEGTPVELSNVLVQVHNTDPKVPWLTSFVETSLLRAIWYPTTVCTNSYNIKQDLIEYARKSGSDVDGILFKLHDFGARGVSSSESAMLGGLSHLVNFRGTDTVESLIGARRYYNEPMAGFSIPAAEHSTITVWGEDREKDAYENMLKQFAKPGSMVAVVSDSYDIYKAVDQYWNDELKQQVIDSGATVIVRPDSGDPVTVPVNIINDLMEEWGYTTNDKGYKTLPSNIRVIQGDGINRESIQEIIENLNLNQLTLDNIAFGMGGALLQHMNRDTLKFAMKASYAMIDGKGVDVFKRPVDDNSKASKKGILKLYKNPETGYFTSTANWYDYGSNVLRSVYKDGKLLIDDSFENIRNRAI